MTPDDPIAIPVERVSSRIFLLRGEKVLFDFDLAELYGVQTKALVQAMKRNAQRFPKDFVFQLDAQEFVNLRTQTVTSSSSKHGGHRTSPYAFTEQGVSMLSSVLRSPRAVQVNIAIMRAFVQLLRMIASHADLARKLKTLERKYDDQFKVVFEALNALMTESETAIKKHGRKIGFSHPTAAEV